MPEPSPLRKRTLELQARARRFSIAVNATCPDHLTTAPDKTLWEQLVRAANSVSNNLIEADDASSDDDFVYKMRLVLREAKESRECLTKIRLGRRLAFEKVAGLEQEAGELTAIFATIVLNTVRRLERERVERRSRRT
jgi:four helix bundle protein